MSLATLDPFEVAASADEVAAFCRAAGLALADDALPLTFPIRWMAAPRVRAALAELLGEPGLVPFHEQQSFDYAAPLRPGVPYTLAISARRDSAPDRLVAEGRIATADGTLMAKVETVLRLFPMPADHAAP